MPPISPDLLKAFATLGPTSLVFLAFAVVAFLLWVVIKAVTTGSLTGGTTIQRISETMGSSGQAQEKNAMTLDRIAQSQDLLLELIRNLRSDMRDMERDLKDLRLGR